MLLAQSNGLLMRQTPADLRRIVRDLLFGTIRAPLAWIRGAWHRIRRSFPETPSRRRLPTQFAIRAA